MYSKTNDSFAQEEQAQGPNQGATAPKGTPDVPARLYGAAPREEFIRAELGQN